MAGYTSVKRVYTRKNTPQSGRCGSGGRGDAGAMEAGALSSPDQQLPTRASRQVHAAGAVAERGGGSRRQAAEEDQHPGGHGAQKPTCPKWLFFCWGEWRAKVALRIEAEQGSTRTRTNQRRNKGKQKGTENTTKPEHARAHASTRQQHMGIHRRHQTRSSFQGGEGGGGR